MKKEEDLAFDVGPIHTQLLGDGVEVHGGHKDGQGQEQAAEVVQRVVRDADGQLHCDNHQCCCVD